MIIEFIIALILGILAGTITGLFPGIHINLIATGLLSLLGYFSGIDKIILVVFIVSMSITHTFLDFIPGIFLGAPEEDSFLAILPGHAMLKEGKGFEATVYTLYGSLFSLPIILLFSFIFIFFLNSLFGLIHKGIGFLLVFISLYLIFSEREWILAGIIFLMSGFLGLFAFNLPIKEPLLPLLSGLFGISGLIISLKEKIIIPKQSTKKVHFFSNLKWILGAAISAPLASFLPGIGSGQAAVLGSEFIGKDNKDKKGFLFLVGAINTIVMALSFVTLYSIGRARTGAAFTIKKILSNITLQNLIIIMGTVIFSGIVAFFIGIFLARIFAKYINYINYRKLSLSIIGILVLITLFLSNPLGLLVLITSSALGVFCILSGVRRLQLMGVLLIPTIIFYLI